MAEAEKKGQVAVNSIFGLKNLGSLNTFPSRGNLDQNTVTLDALLFVHGDQFLGLFNGGILVKGETNKELTLMLVNYERIFIPSIDFCGNTARDDLEDLDTKVDQLTINICVKKK